MKLPNKKITIISLISISLVLIVSLLALLLIKVEDTSAAPTDTIEIRVNKVTTVSIYLFGPGVDLVSSTSNYDTYTAEVGTTVRLQSVNETRIFTEWVITETDSGNVYTPSGVDLSENIINVPVTNTTKDLTVTVNRRDALAEDYGTYMMDRFVINDESDLVALQNILAGSNSNEYFAEFYENADTYNTNVKMENLRKDLQYGYFLIANNITVFNDQFTGIGTSSTPFQGIMCGKNTNISKLFITITCDESTSDSYYGLFKFLGNEALVRNLIVSTSIGITPVSGNANTAIYAGGLAGTMNNSALINVEVAASISIESRLATNIYAGGIAGTMTAGSGIDSISDVVFQGTDAKWGLVSHKQNSLIHAGMVAGTATDTYIKKADIIATDLIVDLENDAATSYTSSKLYLGNVFGSYSVGSASVTLDDVMVMGNSGEVLRAMTTNGDAMVGGLIGYVNATNNNYSLNIGKVYFRLMGTESVFTASTINPTSVGNTYAGGIFGYVNGNGVYGLDTFKNRLETITLADGTTKKDANYLFVGDYNINAIQNGKSTATTNGKAIAGGLVGKGMFNLNGSDSSETNLALASPTATLKVEALQTKMTSTTGTINDKEHACAALIYGSVGDAKVSISNISVYSNNTTIRTTREIGSKAMGDLHSGGFISFARNASSFTNINMYLNGSSVIAESLSYEARNTNEDTNSAFCGGFTGELIENTTLTNFQFAGYDIELFDVVGTTSNIQGVQNTIPGNGNYRGENYVGGVVGRIQYAKLQGCKFYGSSSSDDYIKMSGHESPDSAFCGGIVGLIRTAKNDVPSSVIDCEITDTDVIGYATCIITYSDPDIYLGGIIGAAYIHDTNVTIQVSGCSVTRTNVYALGNEIIAAYAGGIIGGSTWSSSIAIRDCYVRESSVRTNVTTKLQNSNTLESSAGGILGGMKGSATRDNVTVANCAVIDTEVNAEVNSTFTSISAYAAGLLGHMASTSGVTISNCYSNAYVTASHSNSNGASNVYGLTYGGTITSSNKNVNDDTAATKSLYHTFTQYNYTFEVVDAAAGTYRVKNSSGQYGVASGNNNNSYRINFNTTDAASATTFRYTSNNKRLVNDSSTSRFLYFSGTTLNYGTTTNGSDFSDAIKITQEKYKSTSAAYSYYLEKNVVGADNTLGTAIGTGPFNIPNNQTTFPYSSYNYLNGFDGSGQKFYIEIIDGEEFISASNRVGYVNSLTSKTNEPCTALVHIWINAKADGDTTYIPSHDDKDEAAKHGWFIFDYVLLYSGNISNISSDISNLETSYIKNSSVYKHYEVDGTHYVENKNNSSDRIYNNYVEGVVAGTSIPEFTFKVYDDMLTFCADFDITYFGANYQLRFLDTQGNIIDPALFSVKYGSMELTLIEKHAIIDDEYKDKYRLEFKPNELIEDDFTFYIHFIGGNDAVSSETYFKVNLIANKLTLVGVTYADYTPPLNYYDKSGTLGTSGNPYELYTNSITKFIPVFTKSNDIVPGRQYVLEDYIEKCSYQLDNTSDSYFDVHSNGELTVETREYENGRLTVTHKKTGTQIVVYFSTSSSMSVSYSAVGADISGLTYASDSTDFYFEQKIRSNYDGIPTSFTITIGNTVYNLTGNPAAYSGIKVYEKDKNGNVGTEAITKYDSNALTYVVLVDTSLLNSTTVSVEVEYPPVCTITFKLQCESFNDISAKDAEKSFKIIGGTTFKDYFNADIIAQLEEWVELGETFGHVFLGFYLVDSATSIPSYGISFDELVNSQYKINSSNTFFARWSYLVELVEAPGTHIKSGFNNEFMFDYVEDDFTKTIQIPINNNHGYVFRVEKDVHYLGEVGVEAYVIRMVDGEKVMTSVPVENYQNNKNVYYVSPENINGYLVIMTSVGNSEVIVGEHTSAVTENVTPEDGIITFKYIVNHYYDVNGAKSYIFDLQNGLDYATLNKEFVLDFYKQSTHADAKLPDFTEIRVYYNVYVDGATTPASTIVGTYITNNDDRVYLTEFVQLDLETPAFPKDLTFKESFENHVGNKTSFTVTEVFYFSITPPNGYSEKVHNEMTNYVVESGYCAGRVEKHQPIQYLEGSRTELELANPNDLSDIIVSKVSENSKQEKVYHVIPTRKTTIEENNGSYIFIDNATYSVFDIILTDTQKLPDFNYISLYDSDKQSILESSEMSFNIKQVILTLGYRLGKVKVYGKTKAGNWEEVAIFEVESAVYTTYTIDFKGNDPDNPYPYYAFKVDNISTNEIRITSMDVVAATNDVLYEGAVTSCVEKSVNGNVSTYTLLHNVIGDLRHDGKSFMLAVQLCHKDTGEIVENVDGSIYIKAKNVGMGLSYEAYLDDYLGKNVGYINLSKIIKTLNVNQMEFDIYVPDEYSIYAIQLLEVSNEFKPSQGEVRGQLIIYDKNA